MPAGVFQSGNPHICGAARGAAGSAAMEARAFAHARQFWDWQELSPVKAIAVGQEWQIERNELTGIPIFRTQAGFTAYAGAGCSHDIDAQLKMAVEEGVIDGPRIRAGVTLDGSPTYAQRTLLMYVRAAR